MRNGIGASFFAFAIAAAASSACVSGDIDEEKPTETMPADVEPDDATFRIVPRNEPTQQVLVIRMSSIPMCEPADVPHGHPFVEIELVLPPDGQPIVESCRLDQTFRCRIRLMRTTAPECAASSGRIASSGHVQIDEVTADAIHGSFVGTNVDSKIDLRGSFVATQCSGAASCP